MKQELLSKQTNQKGHISSYDNNSKEDDILIEDSIQAFTQRSESRERERYISSRDKRIYMSYHSLWYYNVRLVELHGHF